MTTALTGGSATPLIDTDGELVTLFHIDIPAMGGPVYELGFEVRVTDADGAPENIQSVIVTLPDMTTKRLLFENEMGPPRRSTGAIYYTRTPLWFRKGFIPLR